MPPCGAAWERAPDSAPSNPSELGHGHRTGWRSDVYTRVIQRSLAALGRDQTVSIFRGM
jgi:hypothetical protein